MITVVKLKNLIRNYSKDKNIPHQILYQHFMFERFLERLSISNHKNKFILKGGFLISTLIGIESRTTMDIDMTIKDIKMIEEEVKKIVNEIINMDISDGIKFTIMNIKDIREDDKYTGFRLTILCKLMTLKVYFKLDFSTGDIITPKPILMNIPSLFEGSTIKLWSYNLETILAEKLETILSRGELNTRLKDFYDVYIISKIFNIDNNLLVEALVKTMEYRESIKNLEHIDKILFVINENEKMQNEWENYISQNIYIGNLGFKETIHAIKSLLNTINKYREI